MRRLLVLLALASTSLVAIAFLAPLFVLVDVLATDRATRPAELAARALAPIAALADDSTVRDVLSTTAAEIGGTASVVLPDDRVLGDPVAVDDAVADVRTSSRATAVDQDAGRRFLVPVVVDTGVLVVDVRVPLDRSGVRSAQAVLAVLGVVLVAGATLMSDRIGRRTVDAARRLESTAKALSTGDLDARAGVDEPADLAAVAAALDTLAARIVVLLAEQREAAADLSHGLRTPLTALRLDVEALPASPGRARLLDDLEALDRAVGDVITESRAPVRAGAGAGCDLVEVVEERVGFWSALASDEGRDLDVRLPAAPLRVPMPATEVTTVLDVLFDNAFRHTPAGTDLTVAARTGRDEVRLVIADDGPGFPSGADVLARGWTGGSGSGLGLDIARRLVAAAGGDLEVANRGEPVVRATVTVTLPRRDGVPASLSSS